MSEQQPTCSKCEGTHKGPCPWSDQPAIEVKK